MRWRKRRPACEDGGRYAAVVSAGVVAQSACLRQCQRFWGCGDCGAAVKAHRNLDFDGSGNRLVPARDFFLEKKQKRARCSGLPSRFILCRTCRAKPPVWAAFSFAFPMRQARHALRVPCGRLEPGSGPAHARNRGGPRCAMMRSGQQMQWLEGAWWRKRRRRAVVEEGILGLRGFRALRLKPIGIWISMGSGIASSRRGTSF